MSRHVSASLRRQVRRWFANRCAYCQTAEDLTVTVFEVEHILPRSAGGESVLANLCLACPACNRYKGDRTWAIDPQTGESVPLFHPQSQGWSDHFGWNDDKSEIVAQTDVGRATVAALRMNRPQVVRVRRMWVSLGLHPPKA